MNESALIDDKVEYLAKITMTCVNICAPETKMNTLTSKQSRITNELKNLITKRDAVLQTWILSPTGEGHVAYKTVRNKVTKKIKTEKSKPISTHLVKILVSRKYMQRSNLKKRQSEISKFADADAINENFVKIGSVLAAEIKPIDNKININ